MEEIFGDLQTTQTTVPTSSTNPFSNIPPPSTTQTNPFSATPPQQSYTTRTAPLVPQQTNIPASRSFSPIASPPLVTNPFSEFDVLGNATSGSTGRPTKESFFPSGPPPKTIQQLQMEKQVREESI